MFKPSDLKQARDNLAMTPEAYAEAAGEPVPQKPKRIGKNNNPTGKRGKDGEYKRPVTKPETVTFKTSEEFKAKLKKGAASLGISQGELIENSADFYLSDLRASIKHEAGVRGRDWADFLGEAFWYYIGTLDTQEASKEAAAERKASRKKPADFIEIDPPKTGLLDSLGNDLHPGDVLEIGPKGRAVKKRKEKE